ncbi:MAG: MBL fold metallo-hydrolase [Lachnospiraceae bacterium]|nr:MBL fold metallo-hydrolase [Lachnospiraceae bacterium]
MKITILGARGSIPVEGKEYTEFGGATSCVMVEAGGTVIFLDAGTGIVNAPAVAGPVSVLITHPHIDHLIGLPFFRNLNLKDGRVDIYAIPRMGRGARDQVTAFISGPLWPCTPEDYPADIRFYDMETPVVIGDVKITSTESNHPGGSTVFRLEHEGRSLVYASDYEHSADTDESLIKFAASADLLFYDGQYTEAEYDSKKGYGHSVPGHGVKIMERSGAGMLRIVHHDPRHTDEMLKDMEDKISTDKISFARQGEVIWI